MEVGKGEERGDPGPDGVWEYGGGYEDGLDVEEVFEGNWEDWRFGVG